MRWLSSQQVVIVRTVRLGQPVWTPTNPQGHYLGRIVSFDFDTIDGRILYRVLIPRSYAQFGIQSDIQVERFEPP